MATPTFPSPKKSDSCPLLSGGETFMSKSRGKEQNEERRGKNGGRKAKLRTNTNTLHSCLMSDSCCFILNF